MTKKQLTEKWEGKQAKTKEQLIKYVALANTLLVRVQALKTGPLNKLTEAHAKFTGYKRKVEKYRSELELINEFLKDI